MKLSDFDYELPENLIAQDAAKPRDSARLMVISKDGALEHRIFRDIINYLKPGDVLVLNSTKVLKMKLVGKKESGSRAEIILTGCMDKKENIWRCHVKARNPIVGTRILFSDGHALIISQPSVDEFMIRLSSDAILKHGLLPNPPYIKHNVHNEYQTVYAKEDMEDKKLYRGSLAAPTAGLHFTKSLLKRLREKGVKVVFIKLHVGFGTFLPVYDMDKHETEKEYFEIPNKAAKVINERKGRLIVVGTTTLKALESSSDQDGKIISGTGYSGIFIKPGFRFRSGTDALVTNFHLPKSSLIMLTCAFAGTNKILDAYHVAVKEKYRFFSLGDAMMIWNR